LESAIQGADEEEVDRSMMAVQHVFFRDEVFQSKILKQGVLQHLFFENGNISLIAIGFFFMNSTKKSSTLGFLQLFHNVFRQYRDVSSPPLPHQAPFPHQSLLLH
jgi:hypothetical protein